MPFKSQAQRAKFAELVKDGKMSQETFDKWEKNSPKDLPDRITNNPLKIKKVKRK